MELTASEKQLIERLREHQRHRRTARLIGAYSGLSLLLTSLHRGFRDGVDLTTLILFFVGVCTLCYVVANWEGRRDIASATLRFS